MHFPNLLFEKEDIDFGCILNDTEVTRYINVTNNSPLEVKYKWSFLVDNTPVAIFRRHLPRVDMEEDSDMAAEEIGTEAEHHVLPEPDVIINQTPEITEKHVKIVETDDEEEEKKDEEKPIPEEELTDDREDHREMEHLVSGEESRDMCWREWTMRRCDYNNMIREKHEY